MRPCVLTVDDDLHMRTMLTDALTSEGYEVEQASSAKIALALVERRKHDLIILDVGMPEMDGVTLCRRLRQDPRFTSTPILFLTAYSQPDDIIRGLDAGGDDYTLKPIELPVFLARVRALLRRRAYGHGAADDSSAVLQVRRLTLNSDTYQVMVEGRSPIQLTATEHRLLRYMMENAQQPLSPQRLLEAVWEYPPYTGDPDLVRVHVRNLRSKLESDTRQPEFIQTVHGVGYTLTG